MVSVGANDLMGPLSTFFIDSVSRENAQIMSIKEQMVLLEEVVGLGT